MWSFIFQQLEDQEHLLIKLIIQICLFYRSILISFKMKRCNCCNAPIEPVTRTQVTGFLHSKIKVIRTEINKPDKSPVGNKKPHNRILLKYNNSWCALRYWIASSLDWEMLVDSGHLFVDVVLWFVHSKHLDEMEWESSDRQFYRERVSNIDDSVSHSYDLSRH